jgi:hypothetical protein
LNVDKLLKTYFPVGLEKIFYFTSPTPWDIDKVARHKVFIKAMESTGIEIIYGKFKDKDRKCPHCKKKLQIQRRKANGCKYCSYFISLGIPEKI